MGNVKERGILFSPPMVLAILAGEKRQTRRTLKLPSWVKDTERAVFLLNEMAAAGKCAGLAEYDNGLSVRRFTCPYGQSGDRLWVREAYALLADPGSTRSWDGLIPEERPTPDRTQLGHIPTPIYRCDGERPDVTSQLGRESGKLAEHLLYAVRSLYREVLARGDRERARMQEVEASRQKSLFPSEERN